MMMKPFLPFCALALCVALAGCELEEEQEPNNSGAEALGTNEYTLEQGSSSQAAVVQGRLNHEGTQDPEDNIWFVPTGNRRLFLQIRPGLPAQLNPSQPAQNTPNTFEYSITTCVRVGFLFCFFDTAITGSLNPGDYAASHFLDFAFPEGDDVKVFVTLTGTEEASYHIVAIDL